MAGMKYLSSLSVNVFRHVSHVMNGLGFTGGTPRTLTELPPVAGHTTRHSLVQDCPEQTSLETVDGYCMHLARAGSPLACICNKNE